MDQVRSLTWKRAPEGPPSAESDVLAKSSSVALALASPKEQRDSCCVPKRDVNPTAMSTTGIGIFGVGQPEHQWNHYESPRSGHNVQQHSAVRRCETRALSVQGRSDENCSGFSCAIARSALGPSHTARVGKDSLDVTIGFASKAACTRSMTELTTLRA